MNLCIIELTWCFLLFPSGQQKEENPMDIDRMAAILVNPVELPDPKDIAIFAQFMQKKMEQARKPCSYDEFKNTQHDVLARMIVFNRRLPGEVQALK